MLIGIDASRANKPKRTGTEWYSYHLIRALARLDRENQYRLYTRDPLLSDFSVWPENFKVKYLNWPPKYLWTQGRLSLEMLSDAPDVLFVPAHTLPIISPQNTVTTCHDIGFETFPELYSWKELAYHRFTMRLAVRRARHIITISEFSRQEMIARYRIPESKISVVYQSYDEELYKKTDWNKTSEIVRKYVEGPYLFYVGRLEKKKNVVGLIRAFRILKEKYQIPHKLVLAGGKGTGWEEIEQQIPLNPPLTRGRLLPPPLSKGGLGRDLLFPGWVPQSDLPHLMKGADCFVFPSLYEGFGIPILEAFTAGTPLVASHIASIPEVARDGALYFDPHSVEDMAEKIAGILKNEALKRDLIEKGKIRLRDFSWERCARETRGVLTR
ncbi:MAG: Glycosyl transferase, group 1 [Parcubacteria group bacterium Gr01-1014_18]|nr:MAG: Glycosyl transferase, group 1 [Parcubacteria group bacterium Greene0416_36]TSC81535.1 MAG: Glycosyl transferase, group 1 [Parcubacteria group bacterium Gr01-1014_18]TSC99654.1 MAG: Glycosyl transferase, group 1 [Parcubacteria group bacterium Greene1014_20]